MTVSLFPSSSLLGVVPARDFGVYEVIRMASPTEMAAAAGQCVECRQALVAKIGGRPVPGQMVGTRPSPAAAWSWAGPYCHSCEGVIGTLAA